MPTRTEVEAAAALLSCMANPIRLAVLTALVEEGAQPVGALAHALDVEQTALSHQLRLLREGGLVVSEPAGRRRMYRLADDCVAHIVRAALVHSAELTAR